LVTIMQNVKHTKPAFNLTQAHNQDQVLPLPKQAMRNKNHIGAVVHGNF